MSGIIFMIKSKWQKIVKPLKRQAKFEDDILKFLLFIFEENKSWYFMWIVCLAGNSHEMLRLVFFWK